MKEIGAGGYSPAPDERTVQEHRKRIRAAQRRRLALERETEEAKRELSRLIESAIADYVPTRRIGRWLTSPKRPFGVTRQAVGFFTRQHLKDSTRNVHGPLKSKPPTKQGGSHERT